MKSKSAIRDRKGHFIIDDVEVGHPKAGEVLVQIKAASLCHTDWDSLSWDDTPLVLGHEGSGTVIQIGKNVSRVQEGDAVVLNWAIPCGQCPSCARGSRHICEVNSPVTGTMAGHANPQASLYKNIPINRSFHLGTLGQFTIVKEEALVVLDKDMPFPSASLMGCGVMTGYGSVIHAAHIKAGETIAILGCGGVGLNAIQAARLAGAKHIYAIDKNPQKLDLAREFGATHTILADEYPLMRQQICHLNDNQAADIAVECSAIPELGDAPLALIRNGGRAIQASGIEQKISFDCELFEWDKTYLNPLYGQCNPDRDFPVMMSHYKSGCLKLDEQISHSWELEQLGQAFEMLLSGHGAKNVILMD